MKKTLIISLFALIMSACTQEPDITIEPIPLVQSLIIGTWERSNQAFDFYGNGEFKYYEFDTGMQWNYGYYLDYGDQVYIEDYISGVSVTYFYEILNDGNTLSWYVSGGGDVEWVRR